MRAPLASISEGFEASLGRGSNGWFAAEAERAPDLARPVLGHTSPFFVDVS